MTEPTSARSNLVWWLVLAAIGAAGIYAGSAYRTWFGPRERVVPPPMPLRAGMPLPDVPVVGPDGAAARSSTLAGVSGGLVLFLDPECSPCERMASEWESRRRAGAPAAAGLVAVTEGSSEDAREFATRFALGFPVYADTGRLLRTAGIDDFPIAAWVDGTGKVRSATFDSRVDAPPSER